MPENRTTGQARGFAFVEFDARNPVIRGLEYGQPLAINGSRFFLQSSRNRIDGGATSGVFQALLFNPGGLSSGAGHKLSKEENTKTALPGQDCHRLFTPDAYNANPAARTAPTYVC